MAKKSAAKAKTPKSDRAMADHEHVTDGNPCPCNPVVEDHRPAETPAGAGADPETAELPADGTENLELPAAEAPGGPEAEGLVRIGETLMETEAWREQVNRSRSGGNAGDGRRGKPRSASGGNAASGDRAPAQWR